MDGNFPQWATISTECIDALKDGSHVYINVLIPNIQQCMNVLVNQLKQSPKKLHFYLMSEPRIPEWIVEFLLPFTERMYLQNNDYRIENIHNMPIGIRDGEEVFAEHRHFTRKYLLDEVAVPRDKTHLCYLCFSNTHIERNRCEAMLGTAEFVYNMNRSDFHGQPSVHCGKVPVWVNYEMTHCSHYTLSPSGVGEATHRFYEAIALSLIPIVKRTHTPFDKLYDVFPCLVLDDWSEVTRELLEEKLETYTERMRTFHAKYPIWLTDISYLRELILEM